MNRFRLCPSVLLLHYHALRSLRQLMEFIPVTRRDPISRGIQFYQEPFSARSRACMVVAYDRHGTVDHHRAFFVLAILIQQPTVFVPL